MDKIKINEHILEDDRYLYIFIVEEVNRLASEGMPFRDAYKKVGLDIEAGKFTHDKKVHHTDVYKRQRIHILKQVSM